MSKPFRFMLLALMLMAGCTHHPKVLAPNAVVERATYSYTRSESGRYYVVLGRSEKDINDALRDMNVGPAFIERKVLWVVTPIMQPHQEDGK